MKKVIIFLKTILFCIVAIVPPYLLIGLFQSSFATTSLFESLRYIVDERVARSALGRFLVFVWGMICFIGWTWYVDGKSLRNSILFAPYGKKSQYFLSGFFVQFCIILVAFLMRVLIGTVKIEGFSQNFGNIVSYFIVSALIFGLNVFIEELIFRGYILQKMASIVKVPIACLLSTLLFMIAHPFHSLGLYGVIIQAGIGGFALAYIAYYYQSIYVTFGIHLCNNVISNGLYSSKVFNLTFINNYWHDLNIYQFLWISIFIVFFLLKR